MVSWLLELQSQNYTRKLTPASLMSSALYITILRPIVSDLNSLLTNDVLEGDAALISTEVYEIVRDNKERLDAAVNYKRDYDYDYFGFKTLERSYLLKVNKNIVERP